MLFSSSGFSALAYLALIATASAAAPSQSERKDKDKPKDGGKAGDLPQYCKDDPKTTVKVAVLTNRLTFLEGQGRGGIDLMCPQTVKMTEIGCSIKVDEGFGMSNILTPNAKGGTDTYQCVIGGMPDSNETILIVEAIDTGKHVRVTSVHGKGLSSWCFEKPTSSSTPKET